MVHPDRVAALVRGQSAEGGAAGALACHGGARTAPHGLGPAAGPLSGAPRCHRTRDRSP